MPRCLLKASAGESPPGRTVSHPATPQEKLVFIGGASAQSCNCSAPCCPYAYPCKHEGTRTGCFAPVYEGSHLCWPGTVNCFAPPGNSTPANDCGCPTWMPCRKSVPGSPTCYNYFSTGSAGKTPWCPDGSRDCVIASGHGVRNATKLVGDAASEYLDALAGVLAEQTEHIMNYFHVLPASDSLRLKMSSSNNGSNISPILDSLGFPTSAEAVSGVFGVFADTAVSVLRTTAEDVFSETKTPASVSFEVSSSVGCPSRYKASALAWSRSNSGAEGLKFLGPNTVLSAGSGFGLGVRVYCGCNLIFTTGLGGGMGLSSTGGRVDSFGVGSGGGFQAYSANDGHANASAGFQPWATAGGGGGGGGLAEGCGSSSDAPAITPQGVDHPLLTMAEWRDQMVVPSAAFCPSDRLYVFGAGGGGGGFTIDAQLGRSSQPVQYSLSADITIEGGSDAARRYFDTTCQGGGGGDPSVDYDAMAGDLDTCRKACLPKAVKGDYWSCLCLCMKGVFGKYHLTFADKTKCTTATETGSDTTAWKPSLVKMN